MTASALGLASYIIMYQSLAENQEKSLIYASSAEAEHLASFADNEEHRFEVIATSKEMLRYSKKFSGNVFFGYLDQYSDEFPVLSYVSEQGQEELRIENRVNSTLLINISSTPLFKHLIDHPNKILTEVEISKHFSEPQIVMGYHRKNFFDDFEGILIGRIGFSNFFKHFNDIVIGKTGFLMLIDDQGVVLAHPKQEAVLKEITVTGNESGVLISRAVSMQSGFGRATILQQDSFVAYTPVKGRNWSLMVILPYSEFIAALNELTQVFLSIFLIIILIGIVVALTIASTITKPVLKLIKSSERLAKGELIERVEKNTDDEIGQLALSFNKMAENIESSKSELALVAQDREQLIEDLESKNAELERFTYTVSHDLKSPLVTIKGFIGFLRQGLANGDHQRVNKDLQQIAFAADNMAALLEDLLELSRVGRSMNKFETITLNELFDAVVQLLNGKITETRAIIHLQPDMPEIYADRKRIAEVAQNLLENAMKFKLEDVAPEIHVTANQQGNSIICCVQDNGIGIDPEYHDLIFGLFERLDQSIEGTGIGLALIKRIIEVHQGSLTIQSEGKNRGSRFCFSLPCQD